MAQRLLCEESGVAADVRSAPSWTELRREAMDCDAANLAEAAAGSGGGGLGPYVTRALAGAPGPVAAPARRGEVRPETVRQAAGWYGVRF